METRLNKVEKRQEELSRKLDQIHNAIWKIHEETRSQIAELKHHVLVMADAVARLSKTEELPSDRNIPDKGIEVHDLFANHLDRDVLRTLRKQGNESFSEYAERWKKYADQVEPRMTDDELTVIFVNTLEAPFFDLMVARAHLSFPALVSIGELIEGKWTDETEERNMKNREETTVTPYQPVMVSPPARDATRTSRTPGLQEPRREAEGSQRWPKRKFTRTPTSYMEIYDQLSTTDLLTPKQVPPVVPNDGRHPDWYDPNKSCVYHAGTAGHHIETCMAFKCKVQYLLDSKQIFFEPVPDSVEIPNLEHRRRKRNRDTMIPIPMLYSELLPSLLEAGLLTELEPMPIQLSDPNNESCDYHSGGLGHSTEDCDKLKYKVRELIKAGSLKFKDGKAVIRTME